MNYQIQGLSIYAEVARDYGAGSRISPYWGGTSLTWRKVTAELEGQFKTVAYDARKQAKRLTARVDSEHAGLALTV